MRWCAMRHRLRASPTKSPRERAGALFVAHNARFDYGFLKHAFARLQRAFSARVLCTVRLSRRLLSGRVAAQSRQRDRAARTRARRPASGARRRPRPLVIHPGALSRYPSEAIEAAVRRILKTPSLPPQLAAGCARCPARGAGRLSLLRPQCAAALHRQERQPAGARGCAFFLRLPQRDRSAPVERNPAHRVRGNRGRDRCVAARSGARQVAVAGPQPRAAQKGGIGRARAAAVAWAAGVHPGGRCRAGRARAAGSVRSRRSVTRAKRCARSPPSTALCWKMLGLEKRLGPCFARQVQQMRRRMRRAPSLPRCITSDWARHWHATPFHAGHFRARRESASGRCSAIAPMCT